jgi:hypothetical protein
MKFLAKADLLDKTITTDGDRKIEVLGLASFRTEPRGMGIGRHALHAMKDIGYKLKKPIVCFAFPDVKDFYVKCGFYVCDKFIDSKGREKFILASVAMTVKTTEEW